MSCHKPVKEQIQQLQKSRFIPLPKADMTTAAESSYEVTNVDDAVAGILLLELIANKYARVRHFIAHPRVVLKSW